MDEILTMVLTAVPNMAVALWALWRDDKRITMLLENERWLIEQLMAMHPPQDDPNANNQKETD